MMRATPCDCPAILEAEAQFLAAYSEYAATEPLEQLRARDYARLNEQDQIYLDYTGGGLYADSQIRRHHDLLRTHVFGNPHSLNPSSFAMTELVEQCRSKVLAYFDAAPDEYAAIFTANASAALKLVGEAYPFEPGAAFALTFDNHNSVNGIREFARARGAFVSYVPLRLDDLRVDEGDLTRALAARDDGPRLFAYPAQSNFSGVQHPLEWVDRAHAAGWDVLLDAAAFVPANRLDLSACRPDYVSLSFYKMFGYPTGIGCLIARREALAKLRRPWFAGGTITVASVTGDRFFMAEGPAGFEDGTPDYLGIPGVAIGLEHLEQAGVDQIRARCRCLTAWLLERLAALKHGNGDAVAMIYGPKTTERRGATIAFNFADAAGNAIDHRRVEEAASRHRISLRAGCFCNPGVGETALQITRDELRGCFSGVGEAGRFTLDDLQRCVSGNVGAVRVSLGIASNFADVFRFIEFAREFVEE
jgi:selenocysteine lyase/cysteine desulfurase